MNPIIHSAIPVNGTITIPLGNTCKCHIGLVAIDIPYIEQDGVEYQDISIKCDQIDSSMSNRKRLLRRMTVPKTYMMINQYEFKNILYFPVDSSDKSLTIRIHDQFGPISIPKNVGKTNKRNGEAVTVTLNVLPKEGTATQWSRFI